MSWNRSRIVQHVAASTVATMHQYVPELAEADQSASQTGIDAELESIMEEISASEQMEELAKAVEVFPALASDPKQALADKRRMARRASEANMHAEWITAQIAGASAGDMESYRKASTMRLGPSAIESELSELVQRARISLIPCVKGENGKFQKAKASPSPAKALKKLQDARQALRQFQLAIEVAKASQVKVQELEALRAADKALDARKAA